MWYDEFSLGPGDGLRRSIDHGLSTCRFGVVVLSDVFFTKGWATWELDGLVQRHVYSDGKVIIPLLHKVSIERVRDLSPSLANLVAIDTRVGVDAVARRIADKVLPAARTRTPAFPARLASVPSLTYPQRDFLCSNDRKGRFWRVFHDAFGAETIRRTCSTPPPE